MFKPSLGNESFNDGNELISHWKELLTSRNDFAPISNPFERIIYIYEKYPFEDSLVYFCFQRNFTNVIGILKGERFGSIADRIVGVAAHYDTVRTTAGKPSINIF